MCRSGLNFFRVRIQRSLGQQLNSLRLAAREFIFESSIYIEFALPEKDGGFKSEFGFDTVAAKGRFVATIKRDYIYTSDCRSAQAVMKLFKNWIEDSNNVAPHSGWGSGIQEIDESSCLVEMGVKSNLKISINKRSGFSGGVVFSKETGIKSEGNMLQSWNSLNDTHDFSAFIFLSQIIR